MGSDSSPHVLYHAVLQAAEHFDRTATLVVIATKSVLAQLPPPAIPRLNSAIGVSHSDPSKARKKDPAKSRATIQFHEVADSIAMTDNPMDAVRHKKDSSLVVGIRLLKKRQLEAFVSCGNTGALIASAALSLPMLSGIKRPALLVSLPTERGMVAILDVGSTVISKAAYLLQFAGLGAAYQRAIGIAVPRVGLLNVGIESRKGTLEVREAYESLQKPAQKAMSSGMKPVMTFAGNVEARDVFKGLVDVLVTDGFTGNVLLKTAEGLASFIFDKLKNNLQAQPPEGFCQAFNELQRQFDYAEYPGALVCGVDGIVVKVHGTGCARALFSSIMGAANYVQNDLVAHLKKELQACSGS